jgi:hypothetical protein
VSGGVLCSKREDNSSSSKNISSDSGIRYSTLQSLKVHKIEIFFGFDFEICNISSLVCQNIKILQKNFFDWASIGGGMIFPRSLKTTRNEKKILR